MSFIGRALQLLLEVVVGFLAAGIVIALLVPFLTYMDRMPAYPWNGVLVFGVMAGLVVLAMLRPGGSLRRG